MPVRLPVANAGALGATQTFFAFFVQPIQWVNMCLFAHVMWEWFTKVKISVSGELKSCVLLDWRGSGGWFCIEVKGTTEQKANLTSFTSVHPVASERLPCIRVDSSMSGTWYWSSQYWCILATSSFSSMSIETMSTATSNKTSCRQQRLAKLATSVTEGEGPEEGATGGVA